VFNFLYKAIDQVAEEKGLETGQSNHVFSGDYADNLGSIVTLTEGNDYGVVKVEGGELILDMDDFRPDLGTF
jgi:hypothetical protein